MRQVLAHLKRVVQQKFWVFLLVGLMQWVGGWVLIAQPSYAAENLSSEEKIDRAYDEFGPDAGIEEEIYQKRLSEGQDPEKLPQPYKRIESIDKKEVPETSLVETSVSKARQLIEKVTDK